VYEELSILIGGEVVTLSSRLWADEVDETDIEGFRESLWSNVDRVGVVSSDTDGVSFTVVPRPSSGSGTGEPDGVGRSI